MLTSLIKCLALSALLASGVGSRGPVKYTSVTISKVRKSYWSVSVTYPRFQSTTAVTALANHEFVRLSHFWIHDWATADTKDMEKPSSPWLREITPTIISARG